MAGGVLLAADPDNAPVSTTIAFLAASRQLARASHELCFARALLRTSSGWEDVLQLYDCCGDAIVDDIVDVVTMRLLDLQCQRAQFGTNSQRPKIFERGCQHFHSALQ